MGKARVKYKDRIGQQFNLLTIVSYTSATNAEKNCRYQCICICGKWHSVRCSNLVNGSVKSCGCLLVTPHNKGSNPHIGTVEYNAWKAMRGRCSNKDSRDYHRWGGRGISVCKRWENSFSLFLKDMGLRPSKGHSLDRIDNNGNYKPSNCRWATKAQQNRNQRKRKNHAQKKACLNCGIMFMPSHNGRKYCSIACSLSHKRGQFKGSHVAIPCNSCGADFLPWTRHTKFCSRNCYFRRNKVNES